MRSVERRIAALEGRILTPSISDWETFFAAVQRRCKALFLKMEPIPEYPTPPRISVGAVPPPMVQDRIERLFGRRWDKKRGTDQLRMTRVAEFMAGLDGCSPEEVVSILPADDRAIVERIGTGAYFDWLDTQT